MLKKLLYIKVRPIFAKETYTLDFWTAAGAGREALAHVRGERPHELDGERQARACRRPQRSKNLACMSL